MSTVKKYCYGAKAPAEHSDLVNDQIYKAHKYKNALIAVERTRREKVEKVLKELFPHLQPLDDAIAKLDAKKVEMKEAIAKRNAIARARTATKADRAALKEVTTELARLRATRKEARAVAFKDPTWIQRQKEIDDWDKAERHKLRAECDVYWGTYLTVENSMDSCRSGAPPKFKRFRGDGKVAVQLMGGLSAEDALACTDTRLRVVMHDDRKGTAWMRVGSDEARQPIWTTIPITLHRPLPTGAEIRWATLLRRRVGTHNHWQLQLDINFGETEVLDAATSGVVGVDVGWRLRPTGLRVAYWLADDGTEGELIIPAGRLDRWKHCEQLQSYRDNHFNYARLLLQKWMKENDTPDWLKEATKTMGQWKAIARLAALVLRWRDQRFDEDQKPVTGAAAACREMRLDPKHYGQPQGIFDLLEAWRKKDKHLYDWKEHQGLNNRRWRDDFYRNFAAQLRRKYATIRVEDANWAKLMQKPQVEEDSSKKAMREWMRVASVGRLIQLLKEKARNLEKVPTKWTTMRCHICGEFTKQVDKAQLIHNCANCKESYDQDLNAAHNLLASDQMPKEEPVVVPEPVA